MSALSMMAQRVLAATSASDSGPGSLRQMIADAARFEARTDILFKASLDGQAITLASEILITHSETLLILAATATDATVTVERVVVDAEPGVDIRNLYIPRALLTYFESGPVQTAVSSRTRSGPRPPHSARNA